MTTTRPDSILPVRSADDGAREPHPAASPAGAADAFGRWVATGEMRHLRASMPAGATAGNPSETQGASAQRIRETAVER